MTFPKAILFDLDDTLFDHQHASASALRVMHAEHGATIEFVEFARRHGEVLEEFHQHFLKGRFSLDEARVARMRELFAAFDLPIDDETAQRAANLYRQQHQANRALLPGARELLDALRGQSRLGIVTNNSTAEQHEKLRALGIAHHFDTIVISEDVGIAKPDRGIFDIALARIGAHASEAVFVGDNWHNDVQGAINAGMAAVWLNRKVDNETPASERVLGHFIAESRANAGSAHSHAVQISSLMPLDRALAAIKRAFNNRTPGVTENEQLETLAS